MKTDISISGSMGFYSIAGESKRGLTWIRENVAYDNWQAIQHNGIATDDTRFASDIADGAFDNGLKVAVNGRRYIGNGMVAA